MVSRIEKDNMNNQQSFFFFFLSPTVLTSHIHTFRSEHIIGCYYCARQIDDDLKELRLAEISKTVHLWEENRTQSPQGLWV